MRASIKRIKEWLISNRTIPLEILITKLEIKLEGYYRYYGITDNIKTLQKFELVVRGLLFKWLNRRSQRKSYTWEQFNKFLEKAKLPSPKIHVNIFEMKETISYSM